MEVYIVFVPDLYLLYLLQFSYRISKTTNNISFKFLVLNNY